MISSFSSTIKWRFPILTTKRIKQFTRWLLSKAVQTPSSDSKNALLNSVVRRWGWGGSGFVRGEVRCRSHFARKTWAWKNGCEKCSARSSTHTFDKMRLNTEYGLRLKWAILWHVYACQAGINRQDFGPGFVRPNACIPLLRGINRFRRRPNFGQDHSSSWSEVSKEDARKRPKKFRCEVRLDGCFPMKIRPLESIFTERTNCQGCSSRISPSSPPFSLIPLFFFDPGVVHESFLNQVEASPANKWRNGPLLIMDVIWEWKPRPWVGHLMDPMHLSPIPIRAVLIHRFWCFRFWFWLFHP
jgi:hypothetical protein